MVFNIILNLVNIKKTFPKLFSQCLKNIGQFVKICKNGRGGGGPVPPPPLLRARVRHVY